MHSAMTWQAPCGKWNNHQVLIMNNPCPGEVKVAAMPFDTSDGWQWSPVLERTISGESSNRAEQ
jgi:hypothetical protein